MTSYKPKNCHVNLLLTWHLGLFNRIITSYRFDIIMSRCLLFTLCLQSRGIQKKFYIVTWFSQPTLSKTFYLKLCLFVCTATTVGFRQARQPYHCCHCRHWSTAAAKFYFVSTATTVGFTQARQPNHCCYYHHQSTTAAAFYFVKSRQDSCLSYLTPANWYG